MGAILAPSGPVEFISFLHCLTYDESALFFSSSRGGGGGPPELPADFFFFPRKFVCINGHGAFVQARHADTELAK